MSLGLFEGLLCVAEERPLPRRPKFEGAVSLMNPKSMPSPAQSAEKSAQCKRDCLG
jgi:hypothetical protein